MNILSSSYIFSAKSTALNIDRLKPAPTPQLTSATKIKTGGLTASGPTDNLLPAFTTGKAIPAKVTETAEAIPTQPITPLYESPALRVSRMLSQLRDLAEKAAGTTDKNDAAQLNKQFQKLFGDMMGMFSEKSGFKPAADNTPTRDPMQMIFRALKANGLVDGARPDISTEGGAKQAYSSLGMVLHNISNIKDVTLDGPFQAIPADPESWPVATAGDQVEAELIPGGPTDIKHIARKAAADMLLPEKILGFGGNISIKA